MDMPEFTITDLPETPLESAHLNHHDLPWVDQGYGIEMKMLRVCDASGQWIILNRFPPGTQLPAHRHSGSVIAYTLKGQWGYLESDFTSRAGSVVFEPANTSHTLKVADDEQAEVFFVIQGSLVHLDEQGKVLGVADGHSQLAEYIRLGKEQGHEISVDQLL